MSLFHEKLKSLLQDIQRFLSQTLPKEHLTVKADDERLSIVKKIDELRQKFPQLNVDGSDEEDPVPNNDYRPGERSATTTPYDDEPTYEVATCVPADSLKDAAISGYLLKQRKQDRLFSKLRSARQRRWCAARGAMFYYYVKESDKKQRNSFSLVGYNVRPVQDEAVSGLYLLELVCPTKRTYQFYAYSEEERKIWVEELKRLIDDLPAQGSTSYLNGPVSAANNNAPSKAKNTVEEAYDPVGPMSVPPEVKRREPKPDVAAQRESEIYDVIDQQVTPTVNMGVPPPSENNISVHPPQTKPTSAAEKPRDALTDVYVNLYYSRWSLTSGNPDELSFKSGDVITIVDKRFGSVNWWTGTLHGKEGLVPSTYLKPIFVS